MYLHDAIGVPPGTTELGALGNATPNTGTLPFSFTFDVDYTAAIPELLHLKVAWFKFDADKDEWKKSGDLISKDIGWASGSNGGGGGSAGVPEPSASALALLGVGLLGATLLYRRRQRS